MEGDREDGVLSEAGGWRDSEQRMEERRGDADVEG